MVERQIEQFIMDNYGYPEEEVREMTIQRKMSLVHMRDMEKWEEFKLGLRTAGYII